MDVGGGLLGLDRGQLRLVEVSGGLLGLGVGGN